jgi:hypothetical protein
LRITLNRSVCYGKCPAYKIEIHGDGTVLYDGEVFREPPNGSDASEIESKSASPVTRLAVLPLERLID